MTADAMPAGGIRSKFCEKSQPVTLPEHAGIQVPAVALDGGGLQVIAPRADGAGAVVFGVYLLTASDAVQAAIALHAIASELIDGQSGVYQQTSLLPLFEGVE